MNMDGDLTSRDMNNGEGSNKDNLRFNNQDDNLRRNFSNRKDENKDLRFSNHDTPSLKENLKEGRIEAEKAGRTKVKGEARIRSNDIDRVSCLSNIVPLTQTIPCFSSAKTNSKT
jgi:hypothetical protein